MDNGCNCLAQGLQDDVHPGDYATFGSEAQLRIAETLARSFGHEWVGVEGYDYLNGELTVHDIYLSTLRRRGEHESWQHGIATPNLEHGEVIHRTNSGLGSLGWKIYPNGTVDLAIYRPISPLPVFELRLDIPTGVGHEPQVTVVQHRPIETRHWMLGHEALAAVSEYWTSLNTF